MSKKNQDIPMVKPAPVQAMNPENVAYGGVTAVVNSHINTLQAYVENMAPGIAHTDEEGLQWQLRLYNAINGILRLDDISEMITGMDMVIEYFREYKSGALNLLNTQRYINTWVTDENTRDLYGHILTLLATFSDPAKRTMYGQKMNITGDDNILIHMEPQLRNRFIQYLTRYVQ